MEKRKDYSRLLKERPEVIGVCAACDSDVFNRSGFVSLLTNRLYCIDCIKKMNLRTDQVEVV